MKRFIAGISVFIAIIMLVWGFFKVNIEATEAFNSSKYERSNVDYEKIKKDTGLDLEKLSRDDSFIKTYDEKDKFIVVIGKYKIDLEETIVGRVIVNTLDIIDSGIKNMEEFFYDILE